MVCFVENALSGPGVFLCDLWTLKFQHAVKMLAQWCHPALFVDVDLEKERGQMPEFLYGPEISGLAKR